MTEQLDLTYDELNELLLVLNREDSRLYEECSQTRQIKDQNEDIHAIHKTNMHRYDLITKMEINVIHALNSIESRMKGETENDS